MARPRNPDLDIDEHVDQCSAKKNKNVRRRINVRLSVIICREEVSPGPVLKSIQTAVHGDLKDNTGPPIRDLDFN